MHRKRPAMMLVIALTITIVALLPQSASAAESPVIAQCAKTGTVSTTAFTAKQLDYALAHLPVDLGAYTACSNAIQRALNTVVSRTRATSRSSSTGSGASFLPTWLIILLVVVILGGGATTVIAARRRHGDGAAPGDEG